MDFDEAFLCYPRAMKHLAFDGQLLHGVPQEFASPGQVGKRFSFLVNVWVNHKPNAASVLSPGAAAAMSHLKTLRPTLQTSKECKVATVIPSKTRKASFPFGSGESLHQVTFGELSNMPPSTESVAALAGGLIRIKPAGGFIEEAGDEEDEDEDEEGSKNDMWDESMFDEEDEDEEESQKPTNRSKRKASSLPEEQVQKQKAACTENAALKTDLDKQQRTKPTVTKVTSDRIAVTHHR